jgi:hypothetical protein
MKRPCLCVVAMAIAMASGLSVGKEYTYGHCVTTTPIQCSATISENEFPGTYLPTNALFRSACERHDMCYRFGYRTYGHEQNDCDAEFWNRMMDICYPESADEAALAFFTAGASVDACVSAAEAYWAAVFALDASSHLEGGASRCCAYDYAFVNGRLATKPSTPPCTAADLAPVPTVEQPHLRRNEVPLLLF